MESLTSIAADFHDLIVTFVPRITSLLKDDNAEARRASLHVLVELSKHGM